MLKLAYNIDFEVIAFLFTVLLFIETGICYPRKSRKNQLFRLMTCLVIITEAFDIISAITLAYASSLSPLVNILVYSGYFMSGLFLCFILQYYIAKAIVPRGGKPVLLKLNKIILLVLEGSILLNAVFGFYFSFTAAGAYVHGPLFLVLHAASGWFVLCGSASLAVNRKLLKKQQAISGVLFVSVYFIAVILQTFFFPHILLIMPAASAMLIITIFTLESPDFTELQATLHELRGTKMELEAANEKYYKLAYTDLMTGLNNRTAYNIHLEKLEVEPDKENLVFMIADIDNLKNLNDNLGHLTGDDAIIKTAKLLKRNFTEGCQCYRIGGDEFAVIASGISYDEFIRNYEEFILDLNNEGERSSYPFSIASGYQKKGDLSLFEALRKADQQMYQNKGKK